MATENHLESANYIKSLHKNLRENANKIGADLAWTEHTTQHNDLQRYSEAMDNLAQCWQTNLSKTSTINDRTEWCVNYCTHYYDIDSDIVKHQRAREHRILEGLPAAVSLCANAILRSNEQNIKLLDVGSCNNPFMRYPHFDVIAIDLFPANGNVFKCDFLNVSIGDEQTCSQADASTITSLPRNSFHAIVFSLLLEYLPASHQRKACCLKAYNLLRSEGILLIITPDSKHVGANAKLMKNWQYTLALMGFSRIKYEKLKHITCMVFRKALDRSVTERWAEIHRRPEMTDDLFIPQDFNEVTDGSELKSHGTISDSKENLEILLELPDLNCFD